MATKRTTKKTESGTPKDENDVLEERLSLATGNHTMTVDTTGTTGISVGEQKRRDLENDLNGEDEPEDVEREEINTKG